MNNLAKGRSGGIIPGLEQINQWVTQALHEDIGGGDITTDSIVELDRSSKAIVTAKESIVLCGLDIFKAVFKTMDSECTFNDYGFVDGQTLQKGTNIIQVSGKTRTLLTGERTALNILQRLSGIATQTRQFVEAAHPVTILDTRKTTPGIRTFEKYAVSCGGASNHRFGLFDAVLIKDNHIKIAGGIGEAVRMIQEKLGKDMPVEVEATTLEETSQALAAGADTILLDNMDNETIDKAIKLIGGKSKIEVSGNITLDRLKHLSTLCIDYVSVGALTHSVKAVDLSLNIDLT